MANYLKAFNSEAEKKAFIGANPEFGPCVLLTRPDSIEYYDKLPLVGVYIQHIDGKFYSVYAWKAEGFANDQANGVAVSDGTHGFVMALTESSSAIKWGAYNKTITDIVTSSTESVAAKDFDGAGNTPKIIEQSAGYTSNYITGAPAAEFCAGFTFPNGKTGYLPALGEWQLVYNNKSAVNAALTACGGTALQSSYYWSSTQVSPYNAWRLEWTNGNKTSSIKDGTRRVRAFTAL